jgi:hypothetical protein
MADKPPKRDASVDKPSELGGEQPKVATGGVSHSGRVMRGRDDVSYTKAPDEKIIKHQGAYLVFGTDRPGTMFSGNGALGYDGAYQIDLVVGRMATGGKEGEGLPGGEHVGNSVAADAARITISQLTDIDKNAHLAQGHEPPAPNRSGILVKADAVRIVGRDGVRIITGPMQGVTGYSEGEPNSLGGKIRNPTIELVAGNHTEDRVVFGGLFNPKERIRGLQPVPLGWVLRDALAEFNGIVDDMHGALFAVVASQIVFNAILGIDPLRPWIPPASVATVTTQLSFAMESLWHIRVNSFFWRMNYLYPFGYKYICSRNVKTT